ncbi:MAG: hypothetical protein U1F68_21175 [Gammaproteobacteria bacterium]
MPRLLVLSQTHNLWGGIETWMADVLPAFERAGWDVRYGLALGRRFNQPVTFVRQHPYIRRWRPLDGRVGTPFARQRAVRAELEAIQPDVVLPIALGDVWPAMREFRRHGGASRVLAAVHSQHGGTLADLVRNADLIGGVGVVSGVLFHGLGAYFGGAGPPMTWIRNGAPPPSKPRVAPPSSRLRIGYVGRLDTAAKRVLDLLPILANVARAGVPIALTVAGNGPAAPAAALVDMPGNPAYEMLGFVTRERLYREIYPNLGIVCCCRRRPRALRWR